MENPLYVIGHKNPDSDSVCSAIAYANLKNQLGIHAIAAVNGTLSNETSFLLKTFDFQVPELLTTAKCELHDIKMDFGLVLGKDVIVKTALQAILSQKIKSVFIVDEEEKLDAIVSLADLLSIFTANETFLKGLIKTVKFDNIVKSIEGNVIYKADNFSPNGTVLFIPNLYNKLDVEENSIAVVGNSFDVQRYLIDSKVTALIINGENWVDSLTIKAAKENGVSIVYSPLSLYKISQLIYQAFTIDNFIVKDIVSFNIHDTVDEVSNILTKTRHRTYPVTDDNGRVVGAVSRYHVLNYKKKQIVLVDHNEKGQTLNDIDYADIVEIVDHHRLGGFETVNPIDITCKIVGSTCSIIADMYFKHGITPSKNMAGLMLGGIVSDTMALKSPTTTKFDLDVVKKLCEINPIDINELYIKMIKKSESLSKKTNHELLYEDFKKYNINGSNIAIGQLFSANKDEILKVKDGLQNYMEEICMLHQFDLVLVLFTSPLGEGSYMIAQGKKSSLIDRAFSDVLQDGFAVGILSRKKQVVPAIIKEMEK